jgi:protein-S-isoprenylcysteine O-methyltransferase Ste14
MNDENVFRWVIIAGFLTVTPVGLYYRIRSYTGEKLDRRQEGIFILFGLRLVAAVWFGGLLAYMIHPPSIVWAAVPLAAVVRWFGVVLAVFSAGLKLWTFKTLDRNLTDTVVTREQHSLVTTGPYRWVRHPFYSSLAVDVIGAGLVTANWFVWLTGVMAFVLIWLRTRTEERNLVARFGDEYREYRKNTGRLVPWIGR